MTKVSSIDASNPSHCEWSPDGKFLLTATLSPRLRVDNGVRIFYILGQLIHVQMCDELYQANWRPTPVDVVPPFPQVIPPAPNPSAAAQAFVAVAKPTPTKPAGAYRPPGARGQSASLVYKREEDGGSPARTPGGSGTATPTRPGQNGGNTNGRRNVPGAPTSAPPGLDLEKKARTKRKSGKDRKEQGGEKGGEKGVAVPLAPSPPELTVNGTEPPEPTVIDSVPPTPGGLDSNLDPAQKKVRNLNKKVRLRGCSFVVHWRLTRHFCLDTA